MARKRTQPDLGPLLGVLKIRVIDSAETMPSSLSLGAGQTADGEKFEAFATRGRDAFYVRRPGKPVLHVSLQDLIRAMLDAAAQ